MLICRMVSLCKDEIHKSFSMMQTQEWARCLQRLRVHQIAHKLTDNNDKIEQNPCLSLPAVLREYVRVKQLNLDLCWHSCELQFTWLGTYSCMSRLIISQFLVDQASLYLASGVLSGGDYCDWFLIGRPLPVPVSLAFLSQAAKTLVSHR